MSSVLIRSCVDLMNKLTVMRNVSSSSIVFLCIWNFGHFQTEVVCGLANMCEMVLFVAVFLAYIMNFYKK